MFTSWIHYIRTNVRCKERTYGMLLGITVTNDRAHRLDLSLTFEVII